jgi:hypothetical protein
MLQSGDLDATTSLPKLHNVASILQTGESIQLHLSQSLVDFRFRAVIPNEPDHATQANLLVPEVFRQAKPALITVTSGREGTVVYVAGAWDGMVPSRITVRRRPSIATSHR